MQDKESLGLLSLFILLIKKKKSLTILKAHLLCKAPPFCFVPCPSCHALLWSSTSSCACCPSCHSPPSLQRGVPVPGCEEQECGPSCCSSCLTPRGSSRLLCDGVRMRTWSGRSAWSFVTAGRSGTFRVPLVMEASEGSSHNHPTRSRYSFK